MPIRYAHARARRGDAERPARAAWAARRLLANVADFLFTSGWARTLERSAAPGERSEVRVFANDRQILQHGHSRDDRADARHGHYPSTTVITLRQGLDLIGHGFNSLIELPPVTGKISDDAYHPW